MDRDGDGVTNSGRELFGSFTPQSNVLSPNWFSALADIDANHDGVVDAKDPQFAVLGLWQDANHDGVATTDDLFKLTDAGVTGLETAYKTTHRTDQYGNMFRFRGKVLGGKTALNEWDVSL